MAELSLAAQAVLDAWSDNTLYTREKEPQALSAALRAAANQVVPEEDSYEGGFSDSLEHQCRASERRLARVELLAIAAELDNTNPQEKEVMNTLMAIVS